MISDCGNYSTMERKKVYFDYTCIFVNAITCLINAGELLLEQSPYASVLNDDLKKRCDGCFKEGSKFKRCAICRMVHYCSTTCQVHILRHNSCYFGNQVVLMIHEIIFISCLLFCMLGVPV
mgnify:CR=1 FL=1